MTNKGRPRGFTLVELLVVIAILGVLVSLLLPAVSSAVTLIPGKKERMAEPVTPPTRL